MSPRKTVSELDDAIGHIREERGDGVGRRRRTGVVPISDQVLEVGRATTEAYQSLKQEMEEAVRQGRLVVSVAPLAIRDTAWRDRDERGYSDEPFTRLRDSIARDGQITPVALRKIDDFYEVVFGHRRVAACRALNRPVRAVLVEADERGLIGRMLIENAQRQDLSAIERARHYRRLIEAGLFERGQLASLLGVSPQQVSNILVLAAIPDELIEQLGDPRELSIGIGKQLMTAIRDKPERMAEALVALDKVSGGCAARARALIRTLRSVSQNSAQPGEIVRSEDGRRFGRLSRSGNQIVLRFQPDLDEEAIRRIVTRLPGLYAQATSATVIGDD